MVHPGRRAFSSLALLLIAGLWCALSGWSVPNSFLRQSELSAGSRLENGDGHPATTRRERSTNVEGRTNTVDAADLPDTPTLVVRSVILRTPAPIHGLAPRTIERSTAFARGPPSRA